MLTRFARCQSCGQPLPVQRLGVRMTPLQGRIFDAVARTGENGIQIDDLFEYVFGDRNTTHKALHVHVYRLNQSLERVGYQIFVARMPRPATYRLIKAKRTNPRDKLSARQQKALGL